MEKKSIGMKKYFWSALALALILAGALTVLTAKRANNKKLALPEEPAKTLRRESAAARPAQKVVSSKREPAAPAPVIQPETDAKILYQRGVELYYKGEYDNAIEKFKKAAELSPEFADVYCEMGVSYMEKGQWGNAITSLNKCIQIDPSHPKAQYAIAVSYARKPEPDVKAAREHFEISKKLGFIYPQWFEDFLRRLEAGERFPG